MKNARHAHCFRVTPRRTVYAAKIFPPISIVIRMIPRDLYIYIYISSLLSRGTYRLCPDVNDQIWNHETSPRGRIRRRSEGNNTAHCADLPTEPSRSVRSVFYYSVRIFVCKISQVSWPVYVEYTVGRLGGCCRLYRARATPNAFAWLFWTLKPD